MSEFARAVTRSRVVVFGRGFTGATAREHEVKHTASARVDEQ